jgi:SAM-dependent methyltransferase
MVQNNTSAVNPQQRLAPAEAYSIWAETYDRDPNPLLALEERKLIPLLPALQGSFVLDLACGTGRWLQILLQRGARWGIGMDLCRRMLRQARRKQPLRESLVRADCTAIPISAGTVDLAVCSFAVGYLAHLGPVACELARAIRKGGCLVLSDLHPWGLERGWRRTFRHGGSTVEIQNFHFSIDQLAGTFREHGFRLERIICPRFSEAERPVFRTCGKEHLFERAQEGPAIFIGFFRLGSSNSTACK